ncbi:hypothetical protein [Clostridium sp.]|uniref:hypothetical protein n=1 Tax=Clostridium sp. TaxID=1506 RepID=UPI001B4A45F9|nr:hypothetical protein [Clostridium sp.]MBP3916023.1 hypothetical protein [Clostridium sp.]
MIFLSRKDELKRNDIAPKVINNTVKVYKYMCQYQYKTIRGNKHKKIRQIYGMNLKDAKDALMSTIEIENERKKYRSISNVKILGMLRVKNSERIIKI